MRSERWKELDALLHEALQLKGEARAAYLTQACGGDNDLRTEVESLLAYEDQAENFIETPALDVAAKMMAEEHGANVVVGQTITHYRVAAHLGAGGMGEVYLADDTRLQRRVALKFLPADFTEDKKYLQRFEQEARTVAALSHPNVCVIHEVVETDDGHHCIVMEYVEGVTLRERIAEKRMELSELLDAVIQVTSALSAAHAAGIVHRDIKPENIMLRHDGYVKVLDFGLAKLNERQSSFVDPEAQTMMAHTSPGIVMGTVSYMSPEQARGLPVDARTDVWSLGVVLYEMVAGKQPFVGATSTDVIISIAERQPVPLSKCAADVPTELERIVAKTLAKDRNERYQSAEELLADLKNVKRQLDLGGLEQPSSDRTPATGIRRSSSFRSLTQNRILVFTALVVLVIIAGLVATKVLRQRSPSTPPAEIRSLAVLPFENISGDASQDYFAEGMTDTVIAGLQKVASLRVISRTSAMPYKNSQKSLQAIARELNVDAIVKGSAKRVGERVQMSLQLVRADGERQLWSQDYDRDLRSILILQKEVTQNVSQAIQIKLTSQEEERLSRVRPIDPTAYDYFLRGQFYLSRQTKADNENAIAMFEKAVNTDGNFAAAFAQLAQAYVWRLFLFTPDEKHWEEKAFVAVEKALTIDPDLPEAHLARGRLLWTPANHFPHDKAIREYRRALGLNPSLDEARNQLALVYSHVGLLDESHQELEQAIAINPSNGLAQFRIGETLLFQLKYEEALKAMRAVPPEVNPALVGHEIAWALFNLGRKDEASATIEEFLRKYPEDNGGLFTSLQGVLAAASGEVQVAQEKIRLAVQKGKGFGHFHHTAYYIACAYALMNNADEAIKSLELAAQDGFPCYPLFERDNNLNNLRKDARFETFMAKLKAQCETYRTIS